MPSPNARSILACALALVAALAPAAVRATSVTVSPTRLALARPGAGVELTIRVPGDAPVRYAVRAYRWRERPDGMPLLEPTDDLIVFPQILTIDPHGARSIRVAYVGAMPASEGDYRLIATELPSGEAATPGLAIRTRLSVPVFLEPAVARGAVELGSVALAADGATVELVERGDAHAFLTSLRVTARDGAGAPLGAATIPGWYLLPGQPLRLRVPLPGLCGRARSIAIDATLEGGSLERVVPAPAC